MMEDRIFYDVKDDIISCDFSELTATNEIIDETVNLVRTIVATLPHKVFVLSCWKDATMDPAIIPHFGEAMVELQKYSLGLVRYGANNSLTNITIRSQTVQKRIQKARAHIYETREEALAAVRRLEQET